MNESQASSLAARRPPARGAVLLAGVLALAACGQKGPLFLPSQDGPAAKPPGHLPSAPEDGRGAASVPPAAGASAAD